MAVPVAVSLRGGEPDAGRLQPRPAEHAERRCGEDGGAALDRACGDLSYEAGGHSQSSERMASTKLGMSSLRKVDQ